jgi:phosphoglycolate phosphatase
MNILFDLDGTLTDSRAGILACIRYALTNLNVVPPDDSRMQTYIGPPLSESFGALLDGEAQVARAIELYRERFTQKGMFENSVYPGIPEAIASVRDAGARLFVATSKPRVFAERIVEHFDLRQYFEAVYGSELDGTRSSKTDLIQHVLEDAELDARSTLMIGDRMHDMIGARAHAVAPIGVLWGYGSRDELLAAGAEVLCEQPDDLPRLLDTWIRLPSARKVSAP